jgi:putative ABC transport system substrate-binding protein
MRRREFIALLGGAAAAWPFAAWAQPSKTPTVGFLGASTPAGAGPWVAAFAQRLCELGWTQGRTVAIEYRWAEGRNERMAEIATEFVRAKADVIVAQGTPAALAAKNATATLPIVFALPGDPVGSGLVASLARPGGNVTGLSSQTVELGGKRLDLLREIVPGLRRLAIMANVGNAANVIGHARGSGGSAGQTVSMSPTSKSGEPRILPPPLLRSKVRLMHFTFRPMRS